MLNDLYTPQGETLTGTPWQVYPRPQMQRESYVNLNGQWDFAFAAEESLPEQYPHRIVVPFCPESALSGLKMQIAPGSFLFYRRRFAMPEHPGSVLLHVGAADQVADIYVNQKHMGRHEGGYNSFTVDITDALEADNELVIRCYDDLQDQSFPYGKQTLKRGGMWYTPVSGIWQSVWLESVPENHIQQLDIRVDLQQAQIRITPALSGVVTMDGVQYPLTEGVAVVRPESPHLWTPEDPYLYRFTVETAEDRVDSYFALRTVTAETVNGIPRLCLNGKPYFFHGLLDQGYWPDGIYTPATPQCFEADILAMKRLGFNTLRKHIKVEPEQFYYDCDRLGMVVFQDMVNNGDYSFLRDTALPTVGVQKLPDKNMHRDETARQRFVQAMEETVQQLKNHPCIVYWTIFNEGWGQFDSQAMYEKLRALDGSRIIDATSGWFRGTATDVDSRHIYFGSWKKLRVSQKPLVLSEFGGYACALEEHLFNPEKAYGYKSCKDVKEFQTQIEKLYREKVLPAAKAGLCAAICTQVSDVEDEINGFLTYDRKVNKADAAAMRTIAAQLQAAVER